MATEMLYWQKILKTFLHRSQKEAEAESLQKCS